MRHELSAITNFWYAHGESAVVISFQYALFRDGLSRRNLFAESLITVRRNRTILIRDFIVECTFAGNDDFVFLHDDVNIVFFMWWNLSFYDVKALAFKKASAGFSYSVKRILLFIDILTMLMHHFFFLCID